MHINQGQLIISLHGEEAIKFYTLRFFAMRTAPAATRENVIIAMGTSSPVFGWFSVGIEDGASETLLSGS